MMFDTNPTGSSGRHLWRMATAAGAVAALLGGAAAAPAATVAARRDGAGAAAVLTVQIGLEADGAGADEAEADGAGGEEGPADGDVGDGDEMADTGDDVMVDEAGRPEAPNYRGSEGEDDGTIVPDFPVGIDCDDCIFATGVGIGTGTGIDTRADIPVAEALGAGAAAGRDLSGGDACSAGGDPSGCR